MRRGQTEIIAVSRRELADTLAQELQSCVLQPVRLISICCPDEDHPEVPAWATDCLRVKFYDTTSSSDLEHAPMSSAVAEEIARFLHDRWAFDGTLVVQCDAGLSRSTGVAEAAAILALWDYQDQAEFRAPPRHPNPLVSRRVLQAWSRLYRDCRSCGNALCIPQGHVGCMRQEPPVDKGPGDTCEHWGMLQAWSESW